jgi:hypothetical protein
MLWPTTMTVLNMGDPCNLMNDLSEFVRFVQDGYLRYIDCIESTAVRIVKANGEDPGVRWNGGFNHLASVLEKGYEIGARVVVHVVVLDVGGVRIERG